MCLNFLSNHPNFFEISLKHTFQIQNEIFAENSERKEFLQQCEISAELMLLLEYARVYVIHIQERQKIISLLLSSLLEMNKTFRFLLSLLPFISFSFVLFHWRSFHIARTHTERNSCHHKWIGQNTLTRTYAIHAVCECVCVC